VAVSEVRLAESTSRIVAEGAISTAVCSVKSAVLSVPAGAPLRSVTGASFTWVTEIVSVASEEADKIACWSYAVTVSVRPVGVSLVLLY
jgi:hypothetical protein